VTTENSDVVALPDEASSADTPQEEAIDWEARAKAAEDKANKAENDLKAQRGRRNRQQEQSDLVLQLSNQQRITDRKLDALMQAMGTGDTDTLPEQLTSIQGEQANLNATTAYTNNWTNLSEDLVSVVQDDQGRDIVDLQTAPELAEVRNMWTDAHNRKDVRGLQAAVAEAQKVMRQVERGQRSGTPAAPTEPATAQDSGAFDLDTGPAAGGSGMSDQRWLDTVYGSEDYTPTSDDHKRAKDILDRLNAGG